MTSSDVRRKFIEFFEGKQHTAVPSSPVVPQDDPTLLFTNAGMNQFKDVFLGSGTRPYSRAVDSQKCIRVSGKHNDLEEVGPSPNHHTFFEMLGNWSFGDYYKAEAIRWAWELMTGVYGFDKKKLYATVFEEDDEAYKLWTSETDIDPSHVSKHNHKDNFWEMGETGPCGPCSEIHYDLGAPAPGHKAIENDGPNSESGRFIELWNLVFIQYDRDDKGKLHELPAKHVDTGAGLERIVRALNGVDSNYETDLFKPLIDAIAEASGVPYLPPSEGGKEKDYIPHRAIADHLRMLAFAIADGALPGNEGRGYVLRRVLRRAARFIRELGLEAPFLPSLVPALIKIMGDHYTELKQRQQHIEAMLKAEEEAFVRTLDNGVSWFKEATDRAQGNRFVMLLGSQGLSDLKNVLQKKKEQLDKVESLKVNYKIALNAINYTIEGLEKTGKATPAFMIPIYSFYKEIYENIKDSELTKWVPQFIKATKNPIISQLDAFLLYDTYGFPIDLTEQMARERGISVDVEGFYREMETAKERSRAAGNFRASGGEFSVVTKMKKHSIFTGYDSLREETRVHLVRRIEGTGADGEKAGESGSRDESGTVSRPHFAVVLEKTPFYAESGGQVADEGTIRGEGLELEVYDVRLEGDRRVHYCEALLGPGGEKWPEKVTAEVNATRRRRILPHHTTTHLLQAALRSILGNHVTQAGSLVSPEKMTFDFTHVEKVTPEQIAEAEDWVNARIREDWPVVAKPMKLDEAKKAGAMALFGEKYGEVVRAILIGNSLEDKVSMELCGGTHVSRTGEIGLFRIESETGVSAGVRRMTCTAGEAAWEKVVEERRELEKITDLVASRGSTPSEKLEKLLEEQKRLHKEIERLKQAALEGAVDFLADWGREIKAGKAKGLLVSGVYDIATDRDALQAAGDKIAAELKKAGKEGIGLVGAPIDETFMFVCVVTAGMVKAGVQAGKLVGHVAQKAGGGGGGKPEFATAGSKYVDKARSLLADKAQVDNAVREYLDGL